MSAELIVTYQAEGCFNIYGYMHLWWAYNLARTKHILVFQEYLGCYSRQK